MSDFDMPSINPAESASVSRTSRHDIPPNTIKNRGPNVDGPERIGSGMLGTFLVCWGMRRSGLSRALALAGGAMLIRSEEHTSELQSREKLVCRLLLEQKI